MADDDENEGDEHSSSSSSSSFSGSAAALSKHGSAELRESESEAVVGSMQELLPVFLKLCLVGHSSIRHEAFSLVQSLNAQGMVLPRSVVPTFIAGLCDTTVADLCFSELEDVYEKYPDFFRTYVFYETCKYILAI
jgi:hypothetical protein